MKCRQPNPGFQLGLSCPLPDTRMSITSDENDCSVSYPARAEGLVNRITSDDNHDTTNDFIVTNNDFISFFKFHKI